MSTQMVLEMKRFQQAAMLRAAGGETAEAIERLRVFHGANRAGHTLRFMEELVEMALCGAWERRPPPRMFTGDPRRWNAPVN